MSLRIFSYKSTADCKSKFDLMEQKQRSQTFLFRSPLTMNMHKALRLQVNLVLNMSSYLVSSDLCAYALRSRLDTGSVEGFHHFFTGV